MSQEQQLADALRLAMERAVARLSELAQREMQLRTEISELADQQSERTDLPHAARAIGADMAWSGLIGKRITEKNQLLLRILAEKAQYEASARRAFGRHQAAQTLADEARTRRRDHARSRQQEILDAVMLRSTARSRF